MRNQLGPIKIASTFSLTTPCYQSRKINKTWCDLDVRIETIIKSSKLIIHFRADDIIEIEDNSHYINDILVNDVLKAQINTRKDAKREVFRTYKNEIEYRPKGTIFVQTDRREFSVSLKPADGVSSIPLFWKFYVKIIRKMVYLSSM